MWRRLAVLCLLFAAACESDPGLPPETVPMVSMTLFAGEDLQGAWVEFATRADSTLPDTPQPLAPGDVSLRVVDDSGSSYSLVPVAGQRGFFRASLRPLPGRVYRLEGTVLGLPVSAETRTPALPVMLPAADTLTSANVGTCPPYRQPGPSFRCIDIQLSLAQRLTMGCLFVDRNSRNFCEAGERLATLYLAPDSVVREFVLYGSGGERITGGAGEVRVRLSTGLAVHRWVNLP